MFCVVTVSHTLATSPLYACSQPAQVLPPMIADTPLGREKYEVPSPNSKQPGANRNHFTGALTANILKALQGGCAESGASFAGYSGNDWSGVHLHHPTSKSKDANRLFFGKLKGKVLKEVRTLQALIA